MVAGSIGLVVVDDGSDMVDGLPIVDDGAVDGLVELVLGEVIVSLPRVRFLLRVRVVDGDVVEGDVVEGDVVEGDGIDCGDMVEVEGVPIVD